MHRVNNLFLRAAAAILALVLCITGAAAACALPDAGELTGIRDVYTVSSGDSSFDTFTNLRDGYRLSIPKNMQVDTDLADFRTRIYSDNTEIEIYIQSFENTDARNYINYSNGAMEKASEWGEIEIIEDEYSDNIHVGIFKRLPLRNIENDHNYYGNIDITDEERNVVYSIFVKSSEKISSYDDLAYIAESFETVPKDANAKSDVRKTETVPIMERGWNLETAAWYEKHFGTGRQENTEFGIFEPDSSRLHFETLKAYEEYFDYEFPVLLNYSQVSDSLHPNLIDRLEKSWAAGEKVLELTLQVTEQDSGNMMYDILNGKYDRFLHYYAWTIANFKHPVMFRPFNEMNGDWCVYSAYYTAKDTDIYIAAYRYIYEIFRKEGALENTIWIWNPNHISFPNYAWNHALMYYPGDEYVDVVGMTAYNTGAYYIKLGESWQEFDSLYDSLYSDYCAWFSQPLMITEFSCADFGGNKAKWIENMFRKMKDYPRICMAIWWDGCDWDVYGNVARSYFLDSTPEVKDSFRKGLAGAYDNMDGPLYGTGYSRRHLAEELEVLTEDKEKAFLEGVTLEEYRGTGNDDTRPSWLVDTGSSRYGYTDFKYAELKKIKKAEK